MPATLVSTDRPSRIAGWVGVGCVAGFWVLVLLAQARQPEYRATRDYVSGLASDGARWPLLGITALLVFGVAYLAAAFVLERSLGTRLGAELVAGAGLATWVVAGARIHCPDGAAYCSVPRSGAQPLTFDTGSRFGPHLHGWAVALSYVLVASAMLLLAVRWARRGERARAFASALALVTSLATVPFWTAGDTPGAAQRAWLGILSAWVVLICAQPLFGGGGWRKEPG